jgi:hypothetical protein
MSSHLPPWPVPASSARSKRLDPYWHELVRVHKARREDIPYSPSRTLVTMLASVSYEFEAYFGRYFCHARKHCVRDTTDPDRPVSAFVRPSFLADVHVRDRAFFQRFLDTQTCSSYLEELIQKIDSGKIAY